MGNPILSLRHIDKCYPGVHALDDITIDVEKGEILGLVGENGAGKSTMVKIIAGALEPDSGTITIDGVEFDRLTPKEAMDLGIGIIYQEPNLVPSISVAENVFLGNFPGRKVMVDFSKMIQRSTEVFSQMGVEVDPRSTVEDLTIAKRQMVEIAKSLVRNVKILIMDEPTSPLTLYETTLLFKLVRRLREQGVTVIYITHRMSELFELTDRMTVMRDGKVIQTVHTNEVTRNALIKMMVGRELTETFPKHTYIRGEPILEVKNYTGLGYRDVSFTLHRGEILGFAGLVGAGRTETMRALFGADEKRRGEMLLEGNKINIKSPKKAVDQRLGFLPEDRKAQSVILSMSIRNNITLSILKRISRFGVINYKKETEILNKHKDSLRIKTPSFDQLVSNLSGGNQQKVAISKWLASSSEILIFDEPTRGIDIGAKAEIYSLLVKLAEEGRAIIVVSSEMEEVIGISDRIIVMHEGRITGELNSRADFNSETIMHYCVTECKR